MHSAKLIWVTPNAEQLLADIARVSNPNGQGQPADRLIRYMIKHKHWSPFEMVNMTVGTDTTRDIGRQLLRHEPRPQEFSQRYADPAELGSMVFTEARLQDPKNRQASLPCEDQEILRWWDETQAQAASYLSGKYNDALHRGIAKEVARKILPEGMTPSRLYLNGNLRDWLFMTNTRQGNGTQLECVQVAQSIRSIMREQFPITTAAFEELFEGGGS